jgi:hypothetical protein
VITAAITGWQRVAQLLLVGVGVAGLVPQFFQPLTAGTSYTVAAVTFAVVGWVLTSRRPDNGIGWCFLGMWAFDGLFNLSNVLVHHAAQTDHYRNFWAWLGAWLVGWMFGPLLLIATTIPLLIFPDGFRSRTDRLIAGTATLATAVSVVAEMVSPYLEYFKDSAQKDATLVANNPLGIAALRGWGAPDSWLIRNLALGLVAASTVVAAIRLIWRARRSAGVERVQFRWVVYGAVVMGILLSLTYFPAFADSSALGRWTWSVALAVLPITIGIAILRFHLYDIDRVISRTTSYAIVTSILVAVYAGIVLSASHLFNTTSSLVVAAATLTAAALARPLLRRVQHIVDSRFDRARYDGQRTVEEFGSRLRTEVDAGRIAGELMEVVQVALSPERANLWIRDDV